MFSQTKKLLPLALCLGLSPVALASDKHNIVEARLAGERIVLSPHKPIVAALTLPIGSPAAVYSVVRLSTWGGLCMRVQRASDNATLDIGFVGNVCDKASADIFANGSALSVTTLYDQSGNGNNLSQTTLASQPAFTPLNEWMGIRPVSVFGTMSSSATSLRGAIGGSLTAGALTTYMMMSPRLSFEHNLFWEFDTSTAYTTFASNAYINTGLIALNNNAYVTAIWTPAQLESLSLSASNSTGVIFRDAGQQYTNATAAVNTSIGALQVGLGVAGVSYPGNFDLFGMVVYGAAHTSVQMQSVEAALAASFQPQTSWAYNLVYGGSSLISSWYSKYGQQVPWQSGFGRGSSSNVGSYNVFVTSLGGRSLATEYAGAATYWEPRYSTSYTKNIMVIDAPSNDIAAQTFANSAAAITYADTLYSGTTVAFVSALKTFHSGTGFSVVVPTIIARTTWDTSANWKETARIEYNSKVLSGAVTNGYAVSDRASASGPSGSCGTGGGLFDSTAATTNTTYYYTDAIHLNNNGYGIIAACDKAAIRTY